MLRLIGIVLIAAWVVVALLSHGREDNHGQDNEGNLNQHEPRILHAAVGLFAISAVAWIFWSAVVSLGWQAIHLPYMWFVLCSDCLIGALSSLMASIFIYSSKTKFSLALAILGGALGGAELLGFISTFFMVLNNG